MNVAKLPSTTENINTSKEGKYKKDGIPPPWGFFIFQHGLVMRIRLTPVVSKPERVDSISAPE